MRTILIAEDDKILREHLEQSFIREGYRAVLVEQGDAVLEAIRGEHPDLLLLDHMLPEKTGLDLCRELRHKGCDLPIIMMSAVKKEVLDRIIGLHTGVDDYVVKPFSTDELLARVFACLRRYPARGDVMTGFCFDDVQVDFLNRTVRRAGKLVKLTAKEYAVLALLIRKKGKTVTREELLDQVWGFEAYPTTRTVDTHVFNLRRKLERDPRHPAHFLSDHGTGYRFE